MKDNFEHIFGSVYRVMTQAGFEQAVYHFFGIAKGKESNGWSRSDLRKALQNYPKKYPALVQYHDHMFEQYRIFVYWKPDDKTL